MTTPKKKKLKEQYWAITLNPWKSENRYLHQAKYWTPYLFKRRVDAKNHLREFIGNGRIVKVVKVEFREI